MYTNGLETKTHRQLQALLNTSFPRNKPPKGWDIHHQPAPKLTPEQQQRQMGFAVQTHLDSVAKERGYDGILSLCSYAASADPVFHAEAQAGLKWRDSVWRTCWDLLDRVSAGEIAPVDRDELIGRLPKISWPGA